ncbi:hypothetical protein Pres01_41160 [Metapseudomonas resinovorans]|uniref:DUF5666 domain-containing protein n=1 Tax=Metapseudomonas resinovorans TaxID=53412 RepID=UPI0009845E68|nr:DUF5666 domain-containing protein [Pseudomonas resinovorans]GLZ88065.1 hypothetical protein Pres01_41160 [Pseudomonas resinovorans]
MNIASRFLCTLVLLGGTLLALPASAAPVCLDPGGMGGTGAVATGGIGGTGAPIAPADHGGIGGTGAPADEGGIGGTGIVGTITGFGSICVNGVEVHYDSKVPLSENGVPASTGQLAIGQVVAVEAHASARGLVARNIAILHAYEGPVTAVASANAPLRVMGQPVRIAGDARVTSGLRVGDAVRVSGLRNATGEVVASRIDRAPKLAQASAIGAIERPGELQGLALTNKRLAPNVEVLVRGNWNGRQLDVVQSRVDPGLPFEGRVRNVVVEGLVHRQHGDRVELGGFTVQLGHGTSFSGGRSTELAVDQRVRVAGVIGAGRSIKAERIELVRDNPAGSIRQGSDHSGSGSGETETESEHHGSGNSGSGSHDSVERVRTESSGRDDAGETRERIEREVESASGELERRERIETRESADRVETRERIEIFENGVRVERIERIEKIERSDRPDKPDRVEKIERVERVEKPEKIEKPEKVERVEKVERPETVERPEEVERVDRSGPH